MPIICDKCKQVYLSYLAACPLCAEMSAAANDYDRYKKLQATNAALLEALQNISEAINVDWLGEDEINLIREEVDQTTRKASR